MIRKWVTGMLLVGLALTGSRASGSLAWAQTTRSLYLPVVLRDFDAHWRSPIGIVMYGAVNDQNGLAAMREAGAKWVVTMMHWASIEPRQGQRNWSAFDEKVRNAQAAGMQVFVLFLDNPSWAAPHPDGPVTDTQDLLNFLAAAAERYDGDGTEDAPGSPRVSAWSFYAEPDADSDRYSFKGRWGGRPGEYAQMLSQAAQIIRQKDPRAWVTNGGLAYDWFKEEGGPFNRSFLTDTLSALNGMGGAGQFLDAVAVHYYPIAAHRWPTLREKVQEIRSIMARHGVGELPIVIPEMGYWSASVPGNPALDSDEDQQARRLVQMFVWGWAERVPLMAWFAVFDHGSGTEAHGLFHGRDLNQPKLAYFAHWTLTRELAQAHLLRPLEAPGAEGYVFRVAGGVEKTILWGTSMQDIGVDFPYSRLRLVTYLGEQFEVQDGDNYWDLDQQLNGQIRLRIRPGIPLYVTPFR